MSSNFSTEEKLFRTRLFLETDIKVLSAAEEPNTQDIEKDQTQLTAILPLIDDAQYDGWKEEYIAQTYEQIKDHTFYVCPYMIASMGMMETYEMTIPDSRMEAFKEWINQNPSAFMGQPRDASKEDIYDYIGLHALPKEEA
ncbi:MAG: hypothetical protein K6G01_02035 [Eubacterium sp.]|nr:hypothetical protein [Eubacterium sp.]